MHFQQQQQQSTPTVLCHWNFHSNPKNGFHLWTKCDANNVCFGSNGSKTIVLMVYNTIARQVLIKFKSFWLYLQPTTDATELRWNYLNRTIWICRTIWNCIDTMLRYVYVCVHRYRDKCARDHPKIWNILIKMNYQRAQLTELTVDNHMNIVNYKYLMRKRTSLIIQWHMPKWHTHKFETLSIIFDALISHFVTAWILLYTQHASIL